jgi:hypothetical protein
MRFGNLGATHLLWIMVALAIFYFWSLKVRLNAMGHFAQKDLIADLTS